MQRVELTEFSGIAGQVVNRAVGGSSLVTGVVLGFVLMVGTWVMFMAGTPNAATPFSQIVVAFALARFALNGQFGEWDGTIFSMVGGTWSAVGFVALRYLTLTGIWLVPMLIFGKMDEQALTMMMINGGGELVGFAGIYVLAMMLTPPVFLIVSVSAGNFGDLFSPDHWRRLFAGRMSDLFALYVVYAGGFFMLTVLSLPFVLLALMGNPKFGLVMAGTTLAFLIGISVTLLGRLCGFFASGEPGLSDIGRSAAAPHEPSPDPIPPASPAAAGTRRSVDPMAPIPVAGTQPQSATREVAPTIPISAAAAPALAIAEAPDLAPQPASPPLLDAQRRVESLMSRFAQEPAGVVAALDDLRKSHAADPHVLHALCICKQHQGQGGEAVVLARQAFPLCLERGHADLATDLFKQLRPQLAQLELTPDQVLSIAGALAKQGELGSSAKAFSLIIDQDPGEIRAVKGMLQVADRILNRLSKPEAAAKVYGYLLKNCSSSPLAEFMRRGMEEAQRKMTEGPV